MKWNKFTLKTRAEMEDIVIAALAEAGVQGVEIEDRQPLTEYDKQQMFVDILPDMPEDDGVAYLNFYLEPEEDKEQILADVTAQLYACLTECRFADPVGLAVYAELGSMMASLMMGEWFE